MIKKDNKNNQAKSETEKSSSFTKIYESELHKTTRLSKYSAYRSMLLSLMANNPEIYVTDEYFAKRLGCSIRTIKRFKKKSKIDGESFSVNKIQSKGRGTIQSYRKIKPGIKFQQACNEIGIKNKNSKNVFEGTLMSLIIDKHNNYSPSIPKLSGKGSGETKPAKEKIIEKNNKPLKQVVTQAPKPIHKNNICLPKPKKEDAHMNKKDVIKITFNKTTSSFEGITDQDRENWRKIIPHFETELTKAGNYLKTHERKAIRQFLNNWMKKAVQYQNEKSKNSVIQIDRKNQEFVGITAEKFADLKQKCPTIEIDKKLKDLARWACEHNFYGNYDLFVEEKLKVSEKIAADKKQKLKATLEKCKEYLKEKNISCYIGSDIVELSGKKFNKDKYTNSPLIDIMLGKSLVDVGLTWAEAKMIVYEHKVPISRKSDKQIYEESEAAQEDRKQMQLLYGPKKKYTSQPIAQVAAPVMIYNESIIPMSVQDLARVKADIKAKEEKRVYLEQQQKILLVENERQRLIRKQEAMSLLKTTFSGKI